jgi:hypothetical protein
MVAQAEHDHERAKGLYGEGLVFATEAGNETNVAYCLEGLAALAASEGSLARGARLWGAAEALREKIEVTAYIYAPDRSVHQGQVSAARARLDEAAWQAAWAEGRAMSPEQATGYALSKEEEERDLSTTLITVAEQQPADDERAERLTRREQEIALLVGRGLTNDGIALELSTRSYRLRLPVKVRPARLQGRLRYPFHVTISLLLFLPHE